MEVTEKLCAIYGASAGRVIWFETSAPRLPAAASCTRLLLKDFSGDQQQPVHGPVRDIHACPKTVRCTFRSFAQRLADVGFGFLYERFEEGLVDGPILVAVADQHIVGAIGPLQTMPDRRGTSMLLPQYLGVLPEYRGCGFGRALWRAAMHWGYVHQAAYQLLQAEVDGPSDRLYTSEGLVSLGFVCSVSI